MSESSVTPSGLAGADRGSVVAEPAARQATLADSNVVELRDVLRRPIQLEPHGDRAATTTPSTAVRSTAAVVSALMAGDLVAFFVAWSLLLPFGAGQGLLPEIMALSSAAAMVLFWSSSLYPGYRVFAHELLRRRATAALKIAAVACTGSGLLLGGWQQPILVGLFLGLGAGLQLPVRDLVQRLLHRLGCWGEMAVILGPAARAEEIEQYFVRNWRCGVRAAGPAGPSTTGPGLALLVEHPVGEDLARLRHEHAEAILLADLPGIRISGLRPAELNGEIGLRLFSAERSAATASVNRALDIVMSLCATLLLLPLMLVVALMIFAADPGPVFYFQRREGLRGRQFRIFKFRTMYRDAEQRLDAVLERDPVARAEWTTHFKLRRDPRVLPVIGTLLRTTSVDELPQLLNVLAGDMHIVGPRPFPEYHLAAMDPNFRAKRGLVTPGLTGLWQVSDRSAADLERQQQLDEFYIDNRSFWLDLQIIIQTVPAVIRGDGAY